MAAVIPDEGEIRALQAIKDISPQRVVLLKSNTTPGTATVWGDLTECDFSGYGRLTPSWGAITTDGGGRASMDASTLTFTHNGGATPNDVYGWALIDSSAGDEVILMAERLASPPETLSGSGDSVLVTLTRKARQEP